LNKHYERRINWRDVTSRTRITLEHKRIRRRLEETLDGFEGGFLGGVEGNFGHFHLEIEKYAFSGCPDVGG
jgi:hypothetical protein